jgi:N-acylneuraminate cytidylyltransferase
VNIAVIPARGGSKRIFRKNIKDFHGKPVISYAIKVAQDCQIFDRIIVSTEDEEIASVSASFGASVPWIRDSKLADDFATTRDVMQDAAIRLASEVETGTNICCIYPATPLLKSQSIHAGALLIQDNAWDYVISAVKNNSPIQRAFSLNKSRGVSLNFPEFEITRTQDLPSTYNDAGQFYWGRMNSWKSKASIFTDKTCIVELQSNETVDIDSEEDWLFAQRLYSLLKENHELR